ncbi:MAG TPA: alpha-2-macroglobulin family protein, partial [Pirellulales bacterium]|nr:alpha-2-macroglobulin family protein [Pirellulales bacterium]
RGEKAATRAIVQESEELLGLSDSAFVEAENKSLSTDSFARSGKDAGLADFATLDSPYDLNLNGAIANQPAGASFDQLRRARGARFADEGAPFDDVGYDGAPESASAAGGINAWAARRSGGLGGRMHARLGEADQSKLALGFGLAKAEDSKTPPQGLAYFSAPPSAGALMDMNGNGHFNPTVLFADGTQNNVQLGRNLREADAKKLADELNEAGAVLLPPQGSQETAYWNPVIATDKEGKATITITLPERTTAWKLLAKGVTADTLAGEAEGELVVKKDLFGELKLPLAFTDGDRAEIQTTIHNDSAEKEKVEVTLKSTIGGKSVEEKKTIDAGKGIHDLSFKAEFKLPLPLPAGEGRGEGGANQKKAGDPVRAPAADIELTVVAGNRRDVVKRTIPIRPYGMPVYSAASGTATSDTTAFVEPPEGMTLESPKLEVIVGPNMEQSLLDALLAPAPLCQFDTLRLASGLDTSTSDLMAAVGLQKLLGATRQAGTPQAEALDARVRSSLSLLVSSQTDDGGWSWTGRTGQSNRYTSARVVWALSLAKGTGYKVPDDIFEKAIGYIQNQIAATAETDYDSKSMLLAAMASAGRGDFTLANRLYRNRPALSTGA